jgi:hypothetical protein
MATGFQIANGVDLDNVFDPYVIGSSPSATGFQLSNGVDINTRYAPLFYGNQAAATGFQLTNGSDLNTVFAAFGTARYWPDPLPWAKTFLAQQQTFPVSSVGILEFRTNGDLWWKDSSVSFGVNQGTMLRAGLSANQAEVRVVQTSGPIAVQNDLANFVDLSSQRILRYATSDIGEQIGVFTITIRDKNNTSDSAQAQCSINVSVF